MAKVGLANVFSRGFLPGGEWAGVIGGSAHAKAQFDQRAVDGGETFELDSNGDAIEQGRLFSRENDTQRAGSPVREMMGNDREARGFTREYREDRVYMTRLFRIRSTLGAGPNGLSPTSHRAQNAFDRDAHHWKVIHRSIPHLVEVHPMILVRHDVAHVAHPSPFNVRVRLTEPSDFAQLGRRFPNQNQVVLNPHL